VILGLRARFRCHTAVRPVFRPVRVVVNSCRAETESFLQFDFLTNYMYSQYSLSYTKEQ
jgi:hypothetical protein